MSAAQELLDLLWNMRGSPLKKGLYKPELKPESRVPWTARLHTLRIEEPKSFYQMEGYNL